jgi:DegV family protein with EDD domain
MPNVQIVTDSCAHFATPQFLQQYPMVTVIPNRITIGGKTYREGIDLTPEEAIRLIGHQPDPPLVEPPAEAEYSEVYSRLAHKADAIISIHASREIYKSYDHALAASRPFSGHCPIAVIDSQNLCVGQGMIVKVALEAVQHNQSIDEMVKTVRGAVERVYSVYYVETVNSLQLNKLMSASHSVLSAILNIKPFLSIEHGHLVLVEKVRTRGQAIDRLVEFVIEFSDIEDVVILQHKSYLSEQTRMIQDRLAADFNNQYFPYTVYSSSLAALIGVDATGIVILEKPFTGETDDDF